MATITLKRAPLPPVEGFTINVSIDEMKMLYAATCHMSGAFEMYVLGTKKSKGIDYALFRSFGRALTEAGIEQPDTSRLPTMNPKPNV